MLKDAREECEALQAREKSLAEVGAIVHHITYHVVSYIIRSFVVQRASWCPSCPRVRWSKTMQLMLRSTEWCVCALRS